MTSNRPIAYSYVRFSTPEQSKGDSLRRQTEKAQKYAAKHGLLLDNQVQMQDLGVPAFRGANIRVGALGNFLELVRHGDIAPGSYLLIENIDRLSRAHLLDAQSIFIDLLRSDIKIVTLSNEKVYSKEIVMADQYAIFEIILGFIRANDESAVKAKRLQEAWENKRRNVSIRPLSALAPAWLELRPDRSGFEIIEERAAIVRRIFRMTLDGFGQHRIAATLNREGIAVFGRGKLWHRSYVSKLLSHEAVLGRFTPHRLEWPKGKKVRVPTTTIADYFPAIIEADDFEAVNSMVTGRGAGTGSKIANVLAGLATCCLCGSTMTRVSKGSRSRPALVCVKAKAGAGCEYKSVRCDYIELAITERAQEFYHIPASNDDLEERWQAVLNELESIDYMISNVIDAIKEGGPSSALTKELNELEKARQEIDERASDVGQQVTAQLTNRLQRTVEALVAHLEAGEIQSANSSLRQLFDRVVVDWQRGDLDFEWKHAPAAVSIGYAWPTQ